MSQVPRSKAMDQIVSQVPRSKAMDQIMSQVPPQTHLTSLFSLFPFSCQNFFFWGGQKNMDVSESEARESMKITYSSPPEKRGQRSQVIMKNIQACHAVILSSCISAHQSKLSFLITQHKAGEKYNNTSTIRTTISILHWLLFFCLTCCGTKADVKLENEKQL